MILSLSCSPDAPQGLCMDSHGHCGRVQRGSRSNRAPRHQWTPSRLPTASPTTASARRQPGPPQHTQGAHARHNRGRHTAPRAPWLDRRRVHIPSRAPTLLQPAAAATVACKVIHSPKPAAEPRVRRAIYFWYRVRVWRFADPVGLRVRYGFIPVSIVARTLVT